MDSATAHPDTLSDVNLLILDYLACLAIEGILSRRHGDTDGEGERDGDGGVGWLLSSVNIINSIIPRAEIYSLDLSMAPDLASKLLILRFVAHFFLRNREESIDIVDQKEGGLFTLQLYHHHQIEDENQHQHQHQHQDENGLEDKDRIYNLLLSSRQRHHNPPIPIPRPRPPIRLSTLFPEFIALSTTTTLQKTYLDIAARFVAVAILEEYDLGSSSLSLTDSEIKDEVDDIFTRLAWIPPGPLEGEFIRLRGIYLDTLFPSQDGLVEIENVVSDLENKLITFLFGLMGSLEPPLLLQLERGKLSSLSRAETLALKERVGL